MVNRWAQAKHVLAEMAVAHVKPGMTIGIGSGSTVDAFIDALSPYAGQIQCVAASTESAQRLHQVGVALVPWDAVDTLDFSVDGADAVNAEHDLIKGGGRALVRERLVMVQSREAWILVDASKPTTVFHNVTVPIAILPYAWGQTRERIKRMSPWVQLRQENGDPVVTDDGLYIVDARFDTLDNPGAVHRSLKLVEGVVDTGLFVGYPTVVWVSDGVTVSQWT